MSAPAAERPATRATATSAGAPARRAAPRGSGRRAPTTRRTVTTASVDLLSPWVMEERRVRALRWRFGYAGLALLLVLTAVWGVQQVRLAEVREQLDAENAAGARLGSRIDELAPVEAYVASVARRAQLVGAAMGTEVATSRTLGALQLALPRGAKLESVSVTVALSGADDDPAAAAPDGAASDAGSSEEGAPGRCPGPDPFAARVVVGCVALVGTAPDRTTVAALVRRLGSNDLFVEPFVSTTTVSEDAPLTFTGTVGLSPVALTGRYHVPAGASPAADPDAEEAS